MKTLQQFMVESMNGPVFESFGSSIISEIFSTLIKSFYATKVLFHEMQWDNVTDNDVRKMDPESAKKLAYKKDSNAYILWVAPDGQLIARTIGIYNILLNTKVADDRLKTVKKIASLADYAVIVWEPDTFSTNNLRQIRREAKKDALALKTEEEVRQDNIKRYQKLIKDVFIRKYANKASLEAKFEKVESLYNECSEKIGELENLKDKTKFLSELNREFSEVLDRLEDAAESIEHIKKDTEDDDYYSRQSERYIKMLDEEIEKFEEYYNYLLVKISDD